jgi:mRNA-degrading endonuclease RelE of RelBE toxin-antitoxin system
MPYHLRYSPEALEALRSLRSVHRTAIVRAIEAVLTVNPTLESKARVKRMREPAPTQYRLRVGDFRVFYDVIEERVDIIRVLSKEDAGPYQEGA